MILNDIEYILLRLIRKYCFSKEFLSVFGKYVPHYTVTHGQTNPVMVVDDYAKYLTRKDLDISDKVILELGVGVTNATCYELAARGAQKCYAFEPLAQFNDRLNQKLTAHHPAYKNFLGKVTRITDLSALPASHADLIISHSVLQYVDDVPRFCRQLKRVMRPSAGMLHLVDYRDHFFKYPFHFYKFSPRAWKILSPGLTRLRLSDHLRALIENGFKTEVLDKTVRLEEFRRFQATNRIHADFKHYSDEDLATATAAVWANDQA